MISISDEALASAAQRGLEEAIKSALSDSWGHRDKIPQALTKAMHDLEANGNLHQILRDHLLAALQSPLMKQAVQDAVTRQLADKLGGAFQGVLISAAKKMANTPEMQAAVSRLATEALAGRPAP